MSRDLERLDSMLVLITVQLRKAEQVAAGIAKAKVSEGAAVVLATLQSSRMQLGKSLEAIDRCLDVLNQPIQK